MKNVKQKAELLDNAVKEILKNGIQSDFENELIKKYQEIHDTPVQKIVRTLIEK